jgi:O-antigen ligase
MATVAIQPRRTTTVFRTPAPVFLAVGLAAGLVGILLARDLQIGVAFMIGVLYAPIALLNLPFALVLWTPLLFVDRIPQLNFAPNLVSLMLLAAWLIALPAQRNYVRRVIAGNPAVFGLLALTLGWMTLSAVWATDPGDVAGDIWKWATVALSMFVVATTIGREQIPMIAFAYVAGAGLSVLGAVVPGLGTPIADVNADVEGRLGGGVVDPNYLAAGIVPAMALAAGLLRWVRSPGQRWVVGGMLALLAVGLLLSGSRGGLIAAAVAIVLTLALSRGRRIQFAVTAALAIVLGGLWVAGNSPQSLERIRTFDTGNGREDLWNIAWQMTEDHPVTGVGLNNFREDSPDYFRRPGRLGSSELVLDTPHVVHNTYLQALAELGAVGIILFGGFMVAAMGATWRAGQELWRGGNARLAMLATAVLVAQISALTSAFFLSGGRDDRLWLLFALGPTLTIAARRGTAGSRGGT